VKGLFQDERHQHVDAVGNNIAVPHVDRLLLDPRRCDTTQRCIGPIQANLHGVFKTNVGSGADLGNASDGAWRDDPLESEWIG
jgi:hypothetical protein